jgi:DNA-binding response OmpR family regulator
MGMPTNITKMPIVGGLTSTRLIRSFEATQPSSHLSLLTALHKHVPIFAVSASLVERELDTYVKAGFDGWILKPIDFKRLNTLLDGIVDADVRRECAYVKGKWERGGWFGSQGDRSRSSGGSTAKGSVEGGSEGMTMGGKGDERMQSVGS